MSVPTSDIKEFVQQQSIRTALKYAEMLERWLRAHGINEANADRCVFRTLAGSNLQEIYREGTLIGRVIITPNMIRIEDIDDFGEMTR